MGYKLDPVTVRALGNLSLFPTFDTTTQAPTFNVALARAGLLLVTYTQGTNKGAATYPVLRVFGGSSAANLGPIPIDDASSTTSSTSGLETSLRNALKDFKDAAVNTTAGLTSLYLVSFTCVKLASFQFAEINGGVTPGTLSAQLIVELDH